MTIYKSNLADMEAVLAWLNQNVVGNLVANALWGVPSVLIGYLRLRHHQRQHHAAVHNHISQEFAKLTEKGNA